MRHCDLSVKVICVSACIVTTSAQIMPQTLAVVALGTTSLEATALVLKLPLRSLLYMCNAVSVLLKMCAVITCRICYLK